MTVRRSLFAAAVATFALAGAAQAQTTDPSFRLNNRSNVTIMELYVSSSADRNWGQDRLGANVLAPGQSFIVRLPDGQCVNDIRIVPQNSQPIERMQINTCNLTDINFP
ncbi:hypothetical protein [Neoroseomonas oryzicola]|uniref:Uncharacterized protein n=1 Tax=Neoroseomonas oryzicola TaxID=535904 RepID=A0A9X9WIL7_9PROT|nr:hypothetical protein [Neoroseomonas oryzicola]MBR0660177.1 hypothetical protein [Neoroseomonas oryzicola]NKE20147.1 hypothetical protein [Neoroseomonas oryzicola]